MFKFSIKSGPYVGEDFFIAANSYEDAKGSAIEVACGGKIKFCGEYTEAEAEQSGLDVY